MSWNEKANVYCRNYSLNGFDEHKLLIVGLVVLWVRIVNFCKYNEYLGRFIIIAKQMVGEIALFFILYLVNLIAWALVAEIYHTNMPEFNNFIVAFKNLFFASFGTFDFERIQESRTGKNLGIIYLVAFLTVNVGLFMSMFIAIITALYSKF